MIYMHHFLRFAKYKVHLELGAGSPLFATMHSAYALSCREGSFSETQFPA